MNLKEEIQFQHIIGQYDKHSHYLQNPCNIGTKYPYPSIKTTKKYNLTANNTSFVVFGFARYSYKVHPRRLLKLKRVIT